MDHLQPLLADVLTRAIDEIRQRSVSLYTFALYHDHESATVSVCADTEENSDRVVNDINRYNMKYFVQSVAQGDMDQALLWQANVGRSLSLGDFAMANLARTKLPAAPIPKDFYLTLVRSLMGRQEEVVALAPSPTRLLLCCSGSDEEVKYVWSAGGGDARPNPALNPTGLRPAG